MQTRFLLIGNEVEIRRISVQSILFIEIDDYFSSFYLINNQKFICSKSLCEIINTLPEHFFQINPSMHRQSHLNRHKKMSKIIKECNIL